MKNKLAILALTSGILLTGMDNIEMRCKINDTVICIANGPTDDIFPNTLSLMVVGKN